MVMMDIDTQKSIEVMCENLSYDEAGNLVRWDEIIEVGLKSVAHAISANAAPGTDECGGVVASLTESVMGITAGLVRVAEALESIANAIREN